MSTILYFWEGLFDMLESYCFNKCLDFHFKTYYLFTVATNDWLFAKEKTKSTCAMFALLGQNRLHFPTLKTNQSVQCSDESVRG